MLAIERQVRTRAGSRKVGLYAKLFNMFRADCIAPQRWGAWIETTVI